MEKMPGKKYEVSDLLEKFRENIRIQLAEAWKITNVQYAFAQINFSKVYEENPQLVIEIAGKDVHLFLVMMDEVHDFVDNELRKSGSHLLETKLEARHRVKHELEHIGELIRLGKEVATLGVLVCKDQNNLIDTIPFITHEELSLSDTIRVASAPKDYYSIGDRQIISDSTELIEKND